MYNFNNLLIFLFCQKTIPVSSKFLLKCNKILINNGKKIFKRYWKLNKYTNNVQVIKIDFIESKNVVKILIENKE